MLLFSRILSHRQARRRSVMRILYRIVIISYHICGSGSIISQKIFHLFLCPFTVFRSFSVIIILIKYKSRQLSRRIISCRAPGTQIEITLRRNCSQSTAHTILNLLFYLTPKILNFILIFTAYRPVSVKDRIILVVTLGY